MTTQGELQIASFTELRDAIQDLPPSAKLVALILKHEGTLSQREIATKSHLSERTVRYGLNELQQVDVVESRTSLQDARKRLYTLTVRDSHQDSR
ncbi:M protein trans-acting positive regulator (MGA) [Halohasta litchfieldiae]|jgi:DNA-binding MarR family transcriptional regulator|uniref:Transcriptional regulator, AsnC family n=2 Tax=Haloferacaceae TaxID=1644056 RepID=B9LXD0_HALLT|nr:winged helix-turn-helix transcriptional regulator [Halohasta litchfieldiae]ACM59121.1 putative transcriptional regulator, AsnC family [Halorubrum lacusprofundi ATCC 49239]ATW88334.1 M protein trans-acting positive regulator (MGA) [Halohasta litchfieldiae]SEJ25541.1 M protein trans-acting positive regulator (MGA) HTH domain-containing protein [Halohasta litchfieldiae]